MIMHLPQAHRAGELKGFLSRRSGGAYFEFLKRRRKRHQVGTHKIGEGLFEGIISVPSHTLLLSQFSRGSEVIGMIEIETGVVGAILFEENDFVTVHDFETSFIETEILDDSGGKTMEEMGASRESVARPELFIAGGTADFVFAFKDVDIESCAGEVGGGNETVMACPDNGDVDFQL